MALLISLAFLSAPSPSPSWIPKPSLAPHSQPLCIWCHSDSLNLKGFSLPQPLHGLPGRCSFQLSIQVSPPDYSFDCPGELSSYSLASLPYLICPSTILFGTLGDIYLLPSNRDHLPRGMHSPNKSAHTSRVWETNINN